MKTYFDINPENIYNLARPITTCFENGDIEISTSGDEVCRVLWRQIGADICGGIHFKNEVFNHLKNIEALKVVLWDYVRKNMTLREYLIAIQDVGSTATHQGFDAGYKCCKQTILDAL